MPRKIAKVESRNQDWDWKKKTKEKKIFVQTILKYELF